MGSRSRKSSESVSPEYMGEHFSDDFEKRGWHGARADVKDRRPLCRICVAENARLRELNGELQRQLAMQYARGDGSHERAVPLEPLPRFPLKLPMRIHCTNGLHRGASGNGSKSNGSTVVRVSGTSRHFP